MRSELVKTDDCLFIKNIPWVACTLLKDVAFTFVLLIILTWLRRYRDHNGGSPRRGPATAHQAGLTLAIPPNVGNSGVQFLIVGTAYALSLITQLKDR